MIFAGLFKGFGLFLHGRLTIKRSGKGGKEESMAKTPDYKFGSHLPVLIRAVSLTGGPVLEMGMGSNSSPVLHWLCATKKRRLVSYEANPEYFRWAEEFRCDFHEVECISNWAHADIEREWDVAFIDHYPAWRRKEDIRRLKDYVKYIVIHDSQGRSDREFGYSRIFPLFQWQYNYDFYLPKTSILSNLVDLSDFGSEWE